MKYGNDYVDEKYSSILEPNLFADTVIIPGVTYNDEHEGDGKAGAVEIYKETATSIADPGTPAGDFVDAGTANTLIPLLLNNAYRKSKKIYRVTANSVSYDKAEANLALAVDENKRDRQASVLACLINEGTTVQNTATTATGTAITLRKALRKNHAKPDVVFASVDAFAKMLEEAGGKYTPTTNDRIITTGQVGNYLGMTWFEVDALEGSAKYYDNTGTKRTVSLESADLIVYDHRTLHVVDNLEMMRIIDSENFTGVKAQNEINTGMTVSNAYRVALGTIASGDTPTPSSAPSSEPSVEPSQG